MNEYDEDDDHLNAKPLIDEEKRKHVSYSNIYINKLKRSKYKILNDNENNENILDLLNEWDIAKPKLIVSVTGGAGQFSLPSRIKTAFKYGIAKIAESTDALIITGYYTSKFINY